MSGGNTHATKTPRPSTSARSASISPRTAYFDGAYAPKPKTPTSPADDEMPTIVPLPRSSIEPSTARIGSSVPK